MSDTKYFKTEKDEYVFALTMMDGKSRSRYLHMNKQLYYSYDLATEWYTKIASVLKDETIHTDFSQSQVTDAINKLEYLYSNMISVDDDEEDYDE